MPRLRETLKLLNLLSYTAEHLKSAAFDAPTNEPLCTPLKMALTEEAEQLPLVCGRLQMLERWHS